MNIATFPFKEINFLMYVQIFELKRKPKTFRYLNTFYYNNHLTHSNTHQNKI